LYAHLADEIRATVYRQTMFAEFEKLIHEAGSENIPLTADYLCEKYYDLNAVYHGKNITADRDIELEWSRIPHFYYNFYVFKYATGLAAAMKFADNILSGDAELKEKYFTFLKAGGSAPVLDILKSAGVDFVNDSVVDDALKNFGKMVKKLKELL
jgi:oligoendopeptidase F